jgi:hypothetical protein
MGVHGDVKRAAVRLWFRYKVWTVCEWELPVRYRVWTVCEWELPVRYRVWTVCEWELPVRYRVWTVCEWDAPAQCDWTSWDQLYPPPHPSLSSLTAPPTGMRQRVSVV